MQSTIDFEARKLFEAIKYQIHVAIEYCHKLEDDQSLWIEVFGDVAVDREGAVEVKSMRTAKSSTQPCKAKTWCALTFKWAPVLAF